MSVQWFPGHMHATRKAIAERMKAGIDVVIELLDARLPGSSANPLLAELTARRPALKVLNKQDLADATRTAAWLAHYNAQADTRALGLDASERAPVQRLLAACRELAPQRGGMDRPLRLLICGVPNVGKSTLVNTLAGRKAAKTGDEAGITKNEQRINLADDAYLFDTPGMLWPKIIAPRCGFHLAASGAVGRNAYDEQEVALELLESLLEAGYGALIGRRYRQEEIDGVPSPTLLERIGRFRGAVRSGGVVDLQKASEIVLNDFRCGAIGRVTLETPAQVSQWVAEGQAEDERKREEREAFREERARQRRKARR